ncbi:MAG: CHAT domain-containing protein [Gammaproteobacteria bacterium]|nr:CHAT domain-containing protein [Gammaproteobacteria bacterium]
MLRPLVLSSWIVASIAGYASDDGPRVEPNARGLVARAERLYEDEAYAEALDLLRAALRQTTDERARGDIHTRIARTQLLLHRYPEAIASFDRALEAARQLRDTRIEAALLHALGQAYRESGDPAQAMALFKQALDLRAKTGDKRSTAITLIEIASTLFDAAHYEEALAKYERARELAESAPNSAGVRAAAFTHLGSLYTALGQYEKALQYQEKALQAYGDAGSPMQELASVYHNIGFVLAEKGLHRDAARAFERALALHGRGQPLRRAKTLNSLGLTRVELKEVIEGLASLKESLRIFQDLNAAKYVAATLDSIGTAQRALGEFKEASIYYRRALFVADRLGDKEAQRVIFANLGALYKDQHYDTVAIFFLKLAVNTSQDLRSSSQALDAELRASQTRRFEPSYRMLAGLLIAQGRLPEAERVLGMLKEHEHFEFIRRDADADFAKSRVELLPFEAPLAERLSNNAERLHFVQRRLETLTALESPSPKEQQELNELRQALALESDRLDNLMDELQARLGESQKARLEKARGNAGLLSALLAELHTGTGLRPAVVHFLPGPQATTFLLVTKDGYSAFEGGLGQAAINELIVRLRSDIDRRDGSYLKSAAQLYSALIAPAQPRLRAASVDTLMLYLLDSLRYVPFAALFDSGSDQHLAQQYGLAVYTASTMLYARDVPRTEWSVAALGVSKAKPPLPALPSVPQELRRIVRDPADEAPTGILPGKRYMDEQFTRERLIGLMKGPPRHSVMHIATHFSLQPGSEERSHLLLGDGQEFKLHEFRTDLGIQLWGYDLVTLSGCQTAVHSGANGVEVESLAVILQNKGAKSVLATLWNVQDAGTAQFMVDFYLARGEKQILTKVQALREAQKRFLEGNAQTEGSAKLDLRHPYYWAAFVLLGNWR